MLEENNGAYISKSLAAARCRKLMPLSAFLQRRLSTTLHAAYGDEAWQLVPQSYSLPSELQQWRQWLDEQQAQGSDPRPWMLKTAQHLGKGLVLLPAEQAYQAAVTPR